MSTKAARRPSAVERPKTMNPAFTPGGRLDHGSGMIYVMLHTGTMSLADMRDLALKGVQVEEFIKFAERLGISESTLAGALGIPVSTLTRRKADGRLSPEESDRLASAAKIFHMALQLYGDREDVAAKWMLTPCAGLDSETPLACARLSLTKETAVNLLEGAIRGEFYA